MKTEILRILRNADAHISGQELCEKLGVSRTAIWKNIRCLKEEGYDIEAVQNKGYRILEVPDTIHTSEIRSRMISREMVSEIYYIEEIDSTNTHAKQLAEEGALSGTLVVSDMQSQGKGRRGKTWISQKGTDIYMTLLLRADIAPIKAPMLTLVMGLSVVQGIEKALGIKAQIKWPNDVIISGKKVCGILTEMSAQVDYLEYLVIGVGINANSGMFPKEIAEIATSLSIESGKRIQRAQIIADVLDCFEKNYRKFLKTTDLTGLMEDYNTILINRNKGVKVLEQGNEYTGIATGISAQGELLVKTADQKVRAVFAGEVSVRGLYGYIDTLK